MRLLLSGPITGIKDDNRPEFGRVCGVLVDLGHEVWCPTHEVPAALPYREALARCLAYICGHAEGLVSLQGWWDSPGARAEAAAASAIGLPMWWEERPGHFAPTVHAGNPARAPLGKARKPRAAFAREGWSSPAP